MVRWRERERERRREDKKGKRKREARRAVTGRKREGGKRGTRRQPYWNRGEGGEFS